MVKRIYKLKNNILNIDLENIKDRLFLNINILRIFMNFLKSISIVFFAILFSKSVYSSSSSSSSYFWSGFGTVTHNFKKAQTDAAGNSTVTFKFAPTVLVGGSFPFPLIDATNFSFGVGYAYYSKGDDNSTKNEIILQYHLNYNINSIFNLEYGFSNYITRIGGPGGTKVLNNGTSTATFYIPSETHSSYTAAIDIAAEFALPSNYTLRTQLSLERFLSSDRRTFSHLITLNYIF